MSCTRVLLLASDFAPYKMSFRTTFCTSSCLSLLHCSFCLSVHCCSLPLLLLIRHLPQPCRRHFITSLSKILDYFLAFSHIIYFYFHVLCSFGYIPNTDLMKFLANATSGAYLSKAPCVSNTSNEYNVNCLADLHDKASKSEPFSVHVSDIIIVFPSRIGRGKTFDIQCTTFASRLNRPLRQIIFGKNSFFQKLGFKL